MATYSVNIKDLAGGSIVSGLAVEQLTFGENLNAAGSCNVVIPLYSASAVAMAAAAGKRTIEIVRNGTVRWAGYIWAAATDINGQTVSYSAEGWYSRLSHRTINETYSYNGTEQLNIAWDIINNMQTAYSHGITRWGGESASGTTRQVTYCCYEHQTVSEAIEALAFADNGFDFEIDVTKVWKAYSPRKGSATTVYTFSGGTVPTSTTNIYNLQYDEDAGDLVTEVSVVPDTDFCNDIEVITASTQGTYGTLEDVITSDARVKDSPSRRAMGNEFIRLHKNPHTTVTVQTEDVPWGVYAIGDVVTVNFNAGYAALTQDFRVMAFHVDVVESNEMVTVELDSVIGGSL